MAAIEAQIKDVSILNRKDRSEGHWAWFKAYWSGLARYVFAPGIRNRMAIGCVGAVSRGWLARACAR